MKQQALSKHKKPRKKSLKLHAGQVAAYSGAFLVLVAIVAVGYDSPKNIAAEQAQQLVPAVSDVTYTSDSAPSVDEVIATGIAADLAERANLPIAANAASMSVSLAVKSELAQTDTTEINKPQIVKPTSTNRSIITYKTKKGDTIPKIANQFGISANTVRWANGLADTDAIEPGRKLTILPVSGVLHTVGSGDSVQSLAQKFDTDAQRIVAVNDLELGGLKPGKRIIIPDGVKQQRLQTPSGTPGTQVAGNSGDLGGGVVDSGLRGVSVGNRYAPGNCTWYAYERRAQLGRPVGSFWGNANTWAWNARADGYAVNNRAAAGAVLVDTAGYFGHVGVVERVKGNGDVVITEMNNYAYGGFGIVNQRTISAGQAANYLYIH